MSHKFLDLIGTSPNFRKNRERSLESRYKELERIEEEFRELKRSGSRGEVSSDHALRWGADLLVEIEELEDLSEIPSSSSPGKNEAWEFYGAVNKIAASLSWCFLGSYEMHRAVKKARARRRSPNFNNKERGYVPIEDLSSLVGESIYN